MYPFVRRILFQFNAEKAHHLTLSLLQFSGKLPGVSVLIQKLYSVNDKSLEKNVFGITFPNPVGLAAGLDKNGEVFPEMACLGFGFVEIGTVTPLPQDGNPQPRLFRIIEDEAIINRMGFNNVGLNQMVQHIREGRKRKGGNVILGGNIGKNKLTPNENANDDYLKGLESLHPYVDYFVVNVSSPNTPNLRALQVKEPLTQLLNLLQQKNKSFPKPKPILLKIAPDLTNTQLDDIIEIVENTGIAGIVATNTTIERTGLHLSADEIAHIGAGGLSGKPLTQKSTEVVRYLCARTSKPVIAVGGIMSADDAIEKLRAGAALVQLYSGFIYKGPDLIKEILQQLKSNKG